MVNSAHRRLRIIERLDSIMTQLNDLRYEVQSADTGTDGVLVRLQKFANSNAEFREIFSAIVACAPETAAVTKTAAAAENDNSARVLAVLADRGAMKGADIAAAIGMSANHVSAILSHLKRRNKVVHIGTMWGTR